MKLKANLNSEALKALFLQHVEKLVLGVVLVLVVVFIYNGYSSKGISESPKELKNLAASAKSHINKPTWEEEVKRRFPDGVTGFTPQAEAVMVKSAADKYALPQPWKVPIGRLEKKRTDPKLYPVVQLVARGGYGPLAMHPDSRTGADPLAAAAETGRELSPEALARIPGYRPPSNAVSQGMFFVVLTGLFPYKQQAAEYDEAFAKSPGYDASRDMPMTMAYYIERAEITDPSKEPEWRPLDTWQSENVRKSWADSAPEVVDSRYVESLHSMPGMTENFAIILGNLTAPVLPLMMRDPVPLVTHSGVPLATASDAGTSEEPKGVGPMLPFGPGGPMAVPGGPMSSVPGHVPAAEAAPVERPEYKLFRHYDYSVLPGKVYAYRVRLDLYDPNDPVAATSRSMVGSTSGRSPTGLEQVLSMPAPNPSHLHDEVAARIRRKSDVLARQYLARGREALAKQDRSWAFIWYKRAAGLDARFGEGDTDTPARLADDLRKAGFPASYFPSPPTPVKVNWRETEWSEPCEPVRVPTPGRVLVGPIDATRYITFDNDRKIPTDEPKIKVMAVVWDKDRALDVPGEVEAPRGAVVNFSKVAEAVDPVRGRLIKPEGDKPYRFETGAVVLDIAGGEPLPGREHAPGEVLLMDSAGNLVIRKELEDATEYKRYLFDDATTASGAPGGGLIPKAGGGGLFNPANPPKGK
jgi:hypothetical protein